MGESSSARQPLVERIRMALKERICLGHYLPGEHLVENRLTNEFQVSRPTVREAFRQLIVDDMLEFVPNSGVRVCRLTRSDVCDIFVVREPLEGLAAYLAAKAAQDVVNKFSAINEEIGKSAEVGDGLLFARLNAQFHTAIAENTGNRALIKVLARLNTQLLGYQFVYGFRNVDRERAHREHAEVIAAMLAGKPRAAETAMRRHMRASRDSILRIAEQGS